MKNLVLLIAFYIIGFSSHAQSNALEAPRPILTAADLAELRLMDQYNNFLLQSHSAFNKQQLKDFEGIGGTDRFFHNTWLKGSATNTSGHTVSEGYVFNFNFQTGELYAQWKDTAIVVNNEFLRKFSLEKEGRIHFFVKNIEINDALFFESLGYDSVNQHPKVQLLKMRTVKEVRNNRNDYLANSTGDFRNKFINTTTYFLVFPNKPYSKIKLNKESLLNALTEFQEQTVDFLQGVSKIDEETAAALIAHLNKIK